MRSFEVDVRRNSIMKDKRAQKIWNSQAANMLQKYDIIEKMAKMEAERNKGKAK